MRFMIKGIFVVFCSFVLFQTEGHAKTEQAFLNVTNCSVIETDQNNTVYFIGKDEVIVDIGATLNDLTHYVYACAKDGDDVSHLIDVYSDVNFEEEGRYQIIYKLTDGSNEKFIQTVFVKAGYKGYTDNEPVLIGIPDSYVLETSREVDLLNGVYAFDSLDGEVTEHIDLINHNLDFNQEGIYRCEYSVTNSRGNTSTKSVTVYVLDKDLPFITTDVDFFKTTVGSKPNYHDLTKQIRVYDFNDSDYNFSDRITFNDEFISYNEVGRYSLEITVNSTNNTWRTITRPFYVLEKESPSIFNAVDLTVNLNTDDINWLKEIDIKDYHTDRNKLKIQVIDHRVNLSEEGTYPLYYLVKDPDGNKKLKSIKVKVADIQGPKITVDEDLVVEIDSMPPVWEFKFSAIDREYGTEEELDIDAKEINFTEIGTYPLYVEATDQRGNVTKKMFEVEVVSKASPVLFGVKDRTIRAGTSYNPLEGVKAVDLHDGDLTDQIKIRGYYDSEKEGTYAITLSVKDGEGNIEADTFILRVEETPFKIVSFYIILIGVVFLILSAIVMIGKHDQD